MTCIAWDGKTLAADKRCLNGSLIGTVTKIYRGRGGCLLGFSGDYDMCAQMLDWFNDGADPEKYPAQQRDKDLWSGFLVIRPDGGIQRFERTPNPLRYEDKIFAAGSGREFALAAMYCGKTAVEAVRIACIFDSGCGNGIDTLTLD